MIEEAENIYYYSTTNFIECLEKSRRGRFTGTHETSVIQEFTFQKHIENSWAWGVFLDFESMLLNVCMS